MSFDKAKAKADTEVIGAQGQVLPQSHGLPDTSPTPKKDAMGMDYIPVYEGEDGDGNSVKVSPGKIQRTGVETVTVGKHRHHPHDQGSGCRSAR